MGKRTSQLNEITTIDNNDILYGVDVDDLTHSPDGTSVRFKKGDLLKDANITSGVIGSGTNVIEVLKKVYPVGSVYINATSNTNPSTLLGFGTWVSFGAGRVLVGINDLDADFDTAEETGGAKTHTLTSAEMPTHTHTQNAHTHSFDITRATTFGGNGSYEPQQSATGNRIWSGFAISNATATNQNSGSGGSHNNLQPYIVVHMWKRTE